jgi:AhpD family alkylhydroperoxidase
MNGSRLAGAPGPSVSVRVFARLAGLVARTTPPNLFLTLGRHGRLFWGWLHFASALMPRGRLPRRATEIVILRLASLNACEYELEHHRRLAEHVGLAEDEIADAEHGRAVVSFTALERIAMGAAEILHTTGDLDDETFVALRRHLSDRQLVELVMLVGHYSMLATTIRALRVQPDRVAR